MSVATAGICAEIAEERVRQDERWGEQNWPDGTGSEIWREAADTYRRECDKAHAAGYLTWCHIILEEVAEALAEADPGKLRAELVQAAAVLVAHVEAIDRRVGA